MNYSSQWFV